MASGLIAYLDSVKARDPAARSRWEILLYPGAWALAFHRLAHWLFVGELFWAARFGGSSPRSISIPVRPSGATSSSTTALPSSARPPRSATT